MSSDEYLYEYTENERYEEVQKRNRIALKLGWEELLLQPQHSELAEVILMTKEAIEQDILPRTGVNLQ